ncbi:MAG: DEAD/DEAH box helicase family protein [Nitriliruptor sp.]|uniref:DEAD/DEAH box helicase family protein n=1 Tax=Nitriliruptor sp. TaxID=2448056 RepID=UPI0034A063FA
MTDPVVTSAPTIFLDHDLLDEIADGMDLRVPNAEAVAALAGRMAAHQASGTDAPFEAVVDVATGVGKTFVMAAAIEYLAALGVRTFVTVCHRKAILDKTVANFTPGHPKSVVDHMAVRPVVVTIDDLDAAATHTVGCDPDQVTLYLLSVQSLQKPTTKVGRRTHDFREALGDGLYRHLAAVPDLVVFADEHHVYFGPSFSSAIRDLTPLALVGLTGTPHRKTPPDSIIYRYPLAEAIADRLVKTPVIVGRSDDLADDATKLRDGLTLLRAKQRAADAWVAQSGLPARNLLMLVVAQSIEEAEAVEASLTAATTFDGEYADAVLRIDSSQPDDALEALERVENADSPVRVIVSVQMLQEGWDVATVAVIVSLRASVSDILTEQTLGRGLRLPWGSYVEVPLLNQLDVLAHERYEQVLERAGVALREQRVDWSTWQQQQLAVAEDLAARSASAEAAEAVRAELAAITRYHDRSGAGSLAAPSDRGPEGATVDATATSVGSASAEALGGHGEPSTAGRSPLQLTVETIEDRRREVDEDADAVAATMLPRTDLGQLRLPVVTTTRIRSTYQLVDVAPGLRPRFVELGRRYAADPEDALRRTAVEARVEVGADGIARTVVTTRAAEDRILASTEEVSVGEVRHRLERAILHSSVATGRPSDRHPASLLAEAVLDGAGDDAPVLGRYLDQVTGAVVAELGRAVTDSGPHLATEVDVQLRTVGGPRPRHDVVLDRSHGDFQRRAGYRGWRRSLYDEVAFDSSTERDAALLFDDAPEVEAWLRLRVGDLSVDWTGEGRDRTYHPDFLVAEATGDRHGRVVRRCFVVEVKADRDLDAADVVAKHEAAVRWSARVNADGAATPDEWHVLLVGESAVRDARGSWPQLLQRGRTDLG